MVGDQVGAAPQGGEDEGLLRVGCAWHCHYVCGGLGQREDLEEWLGGK